MLQNGQLVTAVVEDPSLPPGERIRGVGLSVFVNDAFAETALRQPRPYLNARLHEMIVAGRSPILTQNQIAAANTDGGLTLLPLHFATSSLDVSDPIVLRTLTAAQELFRLMHAGYRVKRILKEVVDINLALFMESTGMRLFSDFRETSAASQIGELDPRQRPYLLAVDHADLPLGSAMGMMFVTGDVRFRFSPAEQKLLQCALLQESDEDIAAALDLSADTLRKHWRSIYQRVMIADPLFFPGEPHDGRRGRGKRRHLLRYLAMHMEELRPYQVLRRDRRVARPAHRASAVVPPVH